MALLHLGWRFGESEQSRDRRKQETERIRPSIKGEKQLDLENESKYLRSHSRFLRLENQPRELPFGFESPAPDRGGGNTIFLEFKQTRRLDERRGETILTVQPGIGTPEAKVATSANEASLISCMGVL